jgi:class 3 adenylate cyclase/ligand-binding sensor domain-containing protein
MRILLTIFLSVYIQTLIFAQVNEQNETGTPLIKNYTTKEYKAYSQNWAVVQDKRGVMYFANGDGVLEYDGVKWRLIALPKNHTAKALAIDNNDVIYVGSKSELGYLFPCINGEMKYVSLLNKIPGEYKNFNIQKIYTSNKYVYFISYDKLFKWNGKNFEILKIGPCYCYIVDNNIYVWKKNVGLKILYNDKLISVYKGKQFANMIIISMLAYKKNRILITTRNNGMFLINKVDYKSARKNLNIVKFPTQVDDFIKKNRLIYAITLKNGDFAFATHGGGTVIINDKGNLIQTLNTEKGIQNDTHYFIAQNNQQSLWFAMDNGISKAEINSPLSFWDEASGLKGAVLSVIRYNNIIYVATWQGVYYINVGKSSKKYKSDFLNFRHIQGISTRCWSFLVIKNIYDKTKSKLLASGSDGIYEIKNGKSKLICKGVFTEIYQSAKNPSVIYAAKEDGLSIINVEYTKNDILIFDNHNKLKEINEEIIEIEEDNSGQIWLGTRFNGIFVLDQISKIAKQKSDTSSIIKHNYIITRFNDKNGLPATELLFINRIRNKLIFIYEHGLYHFVQDSTKNKSISGKFVKDTTLNSIIPESFYINILFEDKKANIWMQTSSKKIGKKIIGNATIQNNNTYLFNTTAFKPMPQTELWTIYPEDNGITWFGGDDGLFRYDGRKKYEYKQTFYTLIRKVYTTENDSVVFGGVYYDTNYDSTFIKRTFLTQPEHLKPILKYSYNSINFEYAAPNFYHEASNQYKYFLQGFDKHWSSWSFETKKEYTNLPFGDYKFYVKAKNIFDVESPDAIYEFSILPPWYRTIWAYIIYVLLIAFILFIIIKYSTIRLRKAKIRLEKIIKDRTKEIQKEREKSDKLLLNILPKQIANELKTNGYAKTKEYKMVTVMFADFKEFTKISEEITSQELIKKLDRAFKYFDKLCIKYKLEKIKTIGDAYMCAGGIPKKNKTNPVDVILAAFDMQEFMIKLQKKQKEKHERIWQLRIGIHNGEAIAGVVGKIKFAYDIWGDTVNIASRMESSGQADKINISGVTYEYIKDFFDCSYRGKIYAKNKGEIDMYFVNRIKKDLSKDRKGIIPNTLFEKKYNKIANK